jgi:hypothetical protein
MKTLTILTLLLTVFLSRVGRNTCSGIDFSSMSRITGQVQDGTNRNPIGNATVALFSSKDSTQIAATITNSNGSFSLSIRNPGESYLRFSYPGYQGTTISLHSAENYQSSIQLGIIFLQKQEQELVAAGRRASSLHK